MDQTHHCSVVCKFKGELHFITLLLLMTDIVLLMNMSPLYFSI
uniref:Uncharacterized protein n=1 Tax=Anguilla anguilla TaxID=7936 RepID=A0A0E9TT81_ANGAN